MRNEDISILCELVYVCTASAQCQRSIFIRVCGWHGRERRGADQTTPFGGTIFDQIRFQSELSYGFSSRWNCNLSVGG
jgi:hypothetical protein